MVTGQMILDGIEGAFAKRAPIPNSSGSPISLGRNTGILTGKEEQEKNVGIIGKVKIFHFGFKDYGRQIACIGSF